MTKVIIIIAKKEVGQWFVQGKHAFALSEWRVSEKDIVCIDKFLTLPLLFEFSLVVDKPTFNQPKKTKDSSKFLNRAPKP